MRMTVYLDVLLLSNFWADYALLRACGKLSGAPLRGLRLTLGGLLGAVGALAVLLPPLPLPVCMLGRALLALLMTLAAFGYHGMRRLIRQTCLFYLLSLLFAGAVYLLLSRMQPAGFYTQNTVQYADLSLTVLLAGTAAAAAVSSFCARRGGSLRKGTYRLHLRIGGCDLSMPALLDTGNTLRDAYSGMPVIVCTEHALAAWLSQFPDPASAAASQKGFRLLPVRTVSGEALLPACLPEHAALCREGEREIPVAAVIAVSQEPGSRAPAIVPAALARNL